MTKFIVPSVVLLIVVALFTIPQQGCYYDKEEELYATCDTTGTISYSNRVLPLLVSAQCVSCHSGASPQGGIALENYAQVKAYVDNGKLLCSINHEATCIAMPYNQNKMSDCNIAVITKWINEGALDN